MVEKLIKRLSVATSKGEVEMITKVALEYWLADTLDDAQYEQVVEASAQATERLTPKSVAETAPPKPTTESTLPRDICQKCKAPLSNYQIMMGTLVCVECDRRARNRGVSG
jgi:hypothetical protein